MTISDLRTKYRNETGEYCTHRQENDYHWSPEYVDWLEKKLIEVVALSENVVYNDVRD